VEIEWLTLSGIGSDLRKGFSLSTRKSSPNAWIKTWRLQNLSHNLFKALLKHRRKHSYIFQNIRKEYLNIVNGHLSIKQKFSAIIISCECKYLHSNFHRLPYLLGIKFKLSNMSRISRHIHTQKEKEKGELLLWEYSQRYQNNLQQAFQHLHYPFPHEQRPAAKDHCTVEICYCPKIKILWGMCGN
jgi:hypothetical protein